MYSRCENCGRKFNTGRGYSLHMKRCMQKLKIPGFRRYVRENSEGSDIYCASQNVSQTDKGIITDDYLQAPLIEDTLGTLGESPHAEVFAINPRRKDANRWRRYPRDTSHRQLPPSPCGSSPLTKVSPVARVPANRCQDAALYPILGLLHLFWHSQSQPA